MRIASLVPAATQVVSLLGLRSALVGVTHSCGALADLAGLDARVITRSRVPSGGTSSAIDGAVRNAAAKRTAVQVLDVAALAAAQPDVVLAPADRPGPPAACSLAFEEVRRVAADLEPLPPRLVTHGPAGLGDLLGSLRALGEALDRGAEAARLAASLRGRVERVREAVLAARRRPRVALLAWSAPPIGAGGLLAELVQAAGGEPIAAHPTEASRRHDWASIVALAPDVVVLAPCGLGIDASRAEAAALAQVEGLARTPAARWGQVFAVDGLRWSSPFPPDVVRGLEILATTFHPELPWPEALLGRGETRPVAIE